MKPVLRPILIQTILIIILMVFLFSTGCTNTKSEENNAGASVQVEESSQPIQTVPDTVPAEIVPPVQIVPDTLPAEKVPPVQTTTSWPIMHTISVQKVFYPTGYMGATWAISMMKFSRNNPHSAPDCIMIRYNSFQDTIGWTGIYWQYPDNNWGTQKGYNLSGYSKLTFWARGEEGGEICYFSVGGINGGQYEDSINPAKSTGSVRLTKEWKKYSINLENENLSHIIGGFCYVVVKDQNPGGSTIYLDDIYYE
jgi:hypothetical protein